MRFYTGEKIYIYGYLKRSVAGLTIAYVVLLVNDYKAKWVKKMFFLFVFFSCYALRVYS